ncbi:KVD39 protein, partial [Polypterus senegalus]
MSALALLILTAIAFVTESTGEVRLTQSPSRLSAQSGDTVRMHCEASKSLTYENIHYLAWYQHRPGEAPKPLLYFSSNPTSGISGRFSGSGSGAGFTLTISDVQPEDAGHYYCQQSIEDPYPQ